MSTTRCTVPSSRTDLQPLGCARGFSLVELLAALAIAGLIGAILIGTLVAQLRLARRAADQVLQGDALRTAHTVLAGELRRITPADLRTVTSDSIALRAFRGTALRCGAAADPVADPVIVRYQGDRLPDTAKDSVLVIDATGGHRVSALISTKTAATDACSARSGELLLEWQLAEPLPAPAVLLNFESGRYFLSGRALRYRLGGEGRQPLTAEAFHHPHTQFQDASDGRRLRFMLSVNESVLRPYVAPFAPPPHASHD